MGRAYLKKHSNYSQAVFFCHSLLKQTVLVGVPVDQMELKTDAITRMDLGMFTQILTIRTIIQFAKQDQSQKANVVIIHTIIIYSLKKTTNTFVHIDN